MIKNDVRKTDFSSLFSKICNILFRIYELMQASVPGDQLHLMVAAESTDFVILREDGMLCFLTNKKATGSVQYMYRFHSKSRATAVSSLILIVP